MVELRVEVSVELELSGLDASAVRRRSNEELLVLCVSSLVVLAPRVVPTSRPSAVGAAVVLLDE